MMGSDASDWEKLPHDSSKSGGFNPRSLGSKLAVSISLVLLLIFLMIAKWIELEQTETIRANAGSEAQALATTLHAGLRTLMLNGDGEPPHSKVYVSVKNNQIKFRTRSGKAQKK